MTGDSQASSIAALADRRETTRVSRTRRTTGQESGQLRSEAAQRSVSGVHSPANEEQQRTVLTARTTW